VVAKVDETVSKTLSIYLNKYRIFVRSEIIPMKYLFRHIVFLLFVSLIFVRNVYPQTANNQINPNGYSKIYYPNGQISSEGPMRNGQPDGYWKTYYVTGVLKSEGNRRNSLLDSTWLFFKETADTFEIINYRLGKKNGYYFSYESITEKNSVSVQHLKSKELYVDDKREGQAHIFFPSGKIKQTIAYLKGKKHGMTREFDENGNVITVFEYRNDYLVSRDLINRHDENGQKTGMWRIFHQNGNIKEEQIFKEGVLEGSSRIYTEAGRMLSDRTYREGNVVEEGLVDRVEAVEEISYYKDGVTPKRKGIYLKAVPIGMHIFYNNNGVPTKGIRYNENGVRTAEGAVNASEQRDGLWSTYFENGKLRAKGNYQSDRQNGEWYFYFQDGKTEQIGNFSFGVMDGAWKWFHVTGVPLREEIYLRGKLNGMCVHYSDSGTIIAKGECVEGEREGEWLINVGDVREEGNFIQGLKNGVWKTFYNDGKLYHKGNFVQGDPDGKHEFYYPDGTLKEEQYYVMGRRERNWKKYEENGSLFLTITYKNNNEIRINGIKIEK
jgi:antitoxin component YwqK of YwqJK toxin-antitoxin module